MDSSASPPLQLFRHLLSDDGSHSDGPQVGLLLHGTGGNEHDLLNLGQTLLPGRPLLSLRGRVLENGMPRFFRRFREGVFDLENLKEEVRRLDQFLDAAASEYGFDRSGIIAIGYSNGANMLASLLQMGGVLGRAILLRAMPTFDRAAPLLEGPHPPASVLIVNGQLDPIVPEPLTSELARKLEDSGHRVTVVQIPAGHELSSEDIDQVKSWLGEGNAGISPPTGP